MNRRLAIALCSVADLPAGRQVRLLPAGRFEAWDGRPDNGWQLDGDGALALIAQFRARRDQLVIDYEHQTVHARANGQPAPAAGWITDLEWREPGPDEPGGLYAAVRWTERAAAAIAAGEYRYISPAFTHQDGRPLRLLHAGLTNHPGLDGLEDLAALSAHFHPTEDTMPLPKPLLDALGLGDDASPEAAAQAAAALKARADDAASQIATLKAGAPDPAQYAPVAAMQALQAEVATLRATQITAERDRLIGQALQEGRLLPAQKEWAEKLGSSDLAALSAYIAATPPVAALSGMQSDHSGAGQSPASRPDALATAICSALGLTREEFDAAGQPGTRKPTEGDA